MIKICIFASYFTINDVFGTFIKMYLVRLCSYRKNITTMIRKLFIILSLALLPQLMLAQSMSDDAVIKFVTEQQEKGVDQKTIVTKLLQKGVTTEQLRRIRKKYNAEKEQMGASDLTGKNKGVSRSRQDLNRQIAGEQNQMQQNYMVRSQFREQNRNYGTMDERRANLESEIGFMDIDSLIYYQNYFKDDKQVFGRNIFNNQMLTFQPNQNMATPANYRLGAGDNVIIDVWGASQETFEGEISPDGTVTIEGVGPITLGGLSVSQANSQVKSRLGKFYEGCSVQLTVGNIRTIQVQVMGEVNVPGTYSLSSLSSAFNALYAAGGINEIGTLRNIKVYRGGRCIAVIDVYDYILNGNAKGDVRLNDNDIIVVGPYECLVDIRGKVKRPMFYEMKRKESVKTILSYAGGFTGDAYKKNVRLVRKSGNEYSMHNIEEFDMNTFNLDDGDSIYVDSVIPRFSNMVEIRGAVFHPGMFQMDGKITGVRDLVLAADGLREEAFLERAVMHRTKEDMTLEALSVDIKGILEGTVADIPLRKNDVLFIPSALDMQGELTLKISGEVNYPGTYVYAANTHIEDLILQAGGLTDAASIVKIDVFRRLNDKTAKADNEQIAETFTFSLDENFKISENDFTLKPFDEVAVRKSPSYSEQQNVKIEGAVNFSGQYSMTNKNYTLSDLVEAAGGVSSLAYVKGARLERIMTQEEKNQVEATLRTQQIALYEESMSTSDRNFDLNRADSLLQMKLDIGNTYPVAIDLESALKDKKGADDIVLREGDKLIIPQYSNTIKISGDVNYPITMNYDKGKALNYYIKRAGGYGDNARKKRVYAIYMNGSVKQIGHFKSKDIQPGCQIVVPSKKQKNKMSTAEILSIGSSSASIAAVVATIANLLK